MLDASVLPPLTLVLLVFGVAFFYSSVGFGGASGYLAAMSLFAIPVQVMASTALMLNVLVATLAFVAYSRAGHFSIRLLLPFLIGSVPTAFLGGYLPLTDTTYFLLLNGALLYVGLRLVLNWGGSAGDGRRTTPAPILIMMLVGAGIGLLSGMLGLGGGIFLSPLIVLTRWGEPKQAAATSAGFIVINSVSGILGRMAGDTLVIGWLGVGLLPAGLLGGMLGSRIGANYLSGLNVRRLLGMILLLTVLRYGVSLFM